MNTLLWKRTSFDENWHKWSKWQRHGMVKFWGQEVKRHRKPKIDLKAWWRHRSGLPWLEYHLLVIFEFCYSQIICKNCYTCWAFECFTWLYLWHEDYSFAGCPAGTGCWSCSRCRSLFHLLYLPAAFFQQWLMNSNTSIVPWLFTPQMDGTSLR